mmetsp:Transcript_21260/g.53906  ORF Transcript_21260/g.53906 Transcript_21260/m.53906 type:complete len:206 (+) Transcript_21260:461-1078(+)
MNHNRGGSSALGLASRHAHIECMRALLASGADIFDGKEGFHCAFGYAQGNLPALKLLVAYGRKVGVPYAVFRRELSDSKSRDWLRTTRRWTTALHHFEALTAETVRELLLDGADVHASNGKANAPTPLDLARARLLVDGSDERAKMIVDGGRSWSPATHALFPKAARARAVELLVVGKVLARDRADGGVLLDVWGGVMGHAVRLW